MLEVKVVTTVSLGKLIANATKTTVYYEVIPSKSPLKEDTIKAS